MSTAIPTLYSFRRCPYAMRARMALRVAGVECELREVVLRDKPAQMIEASAKATVPVLVLEGGKVIDESHDIMLWALDQNDPERWLTPDVGTKDDMLVLIAACEEDFKPHLDRYKYSNRYEEADPEDHRQKAEVYLAKLEKRLASEKFLFGMRRTLADMAIAPFIRQFANTDRAWFDASPYPHVQRWLGDFLEADAFTAVMSKYKKWEEGAEQVIFP